MQQRRDRFEEIYRRYSGQILAYAVRRTLDAADAADVMAETFVVAWRRLDDVPGGIEARPWLYAVARRVLANHHRSVRRRRRLDEQLAADLAGVFTVSSSGSGDSDLAAVAKALDALSAADRELITLVGWDELSPNEIAVVLDISAPTTRVRLHRARRRFARHLADEGVQRPAPSGHEQDRRVITTRPDPEDAR